MGNVFKQKITNFSGGLLEDKRISSPSHFSITKHFDTFTYQTKIVPYAKRETSLGLNGGIISDIKLTAFQYAPNGSTLFRLWGLGDDGAGKIKVFKFDIDGSSNLDTQNWVAATNGASASGARSTTVFKYYRSYLYMYQGTTSIARFKTDEGTSFGDSWQTIDDSTIGVQPVHHPSDDMLYFFGSNHVYSWDDSSFLTALTLPTDMQIAAACPFGNYLAIGCVTKGNLDKRTIIFLWDRDSSLTTLTERIDMGEGTLIHLANLNNKLIAIMNFYADNLYSISKQKVLIKAPSGQYGVTLNELTIDTTQAAGDFPTTDFVRNNKLYFPLKATLNGDKRVGIWVVDDAGRITLDQYEPALEATSSAVKGIYATANLWWISYDDGTGAIQVTRTDNDGLYDTVNPSIYESLKLSTIHVTNRGVVIEDAGTTKTLRGFTVLTEPLPSGASVVAKYRRTNTNADGTYAAETAWTTIFTANAQNSAMTDVTRMPDGSALPEYLEIQFRIESYGGAAITGFEYSAETKDTAPYDP